MNAHSKKKKNMRIIGISFDSAQLLFDCSCSPLSSTQRLYNTFKVRDAVFADRCEHALVFCIVHNIFSTRHFSAVSSQAQTQHEIILSERKFMSVFANEMWGLVLLEDVDRSMVRCVVCGRKHCSHTNLLSRSGLKHVDRMKSSTPRKQPVIEAYVCESLPADISSAELKQTHQDLR